MSYRFQLFACIAAWFLANATAFGENHLPIGAGAPEFSLEDTNGRTWTKSDFAEKKTLVVAFLGVECPLVQQYAGRLGEMAREYDAKGVAFVAINSNQQDSLAEIAHLVRTHKIDFPVVKDPGNKVADAFGAERTPEIFVFDGERKVAYHGAIDNQYSYGVSRPKATEHYLRAAIDSLVAGEPVATAETKVVGCHIGRIFQSQESSDVTYSRQISRILQKHCVECHRPGEVAPFALTNYDETVGWAEMIDEVVQEQRMPPWHANPEHGTFLNDARLSDEEKTQISEWVAAGAPEGDPAEAPPPMEFVEGWRIGEPDQVIFMRDAPFAVPASGEVRYQYFMVDPGFTEDKWVQAAECRAGNRAVVHHIIVAIAPEDRPSGARRDFSQWITASAPGSKPLQLPEGFAKLIPAGSKLVFQMHYTPNGVAQEDLSCVGFKFADPATIKKEVLTQAAANGGFRIPPGAANHKVEGAHAFSRDTLMLAMFPHMHLRGKSFRYTAHYPDGKTEILLDVPRYDFNWQNAYVFPEPKLMPANTILKCEAAFDNSEQNLANPDPSVEVRWGDQTWEEMMIGYFDAADAHQDLTKPQAADEKRSAKFLADYQAGKIDVEAFFAGEEVKKLAADALTSNEALKTFGLKLRAILPQLDRLCYSTVRDGKLTVHIVAQDSKIDRQVDRPGVTLRAENTGLAECAAAEQTTVYDRLARRLRVDLRLMSRFFGSSAHTPLSGERGPGTINFWSVDEEAFPPEAVAIIERATKAMTGE